MAKHVARGSKSLARPGAKTSATATASARLESASSNAACATVHPARRNKFCALRNRSLADREVFLQCPGDWVSQIFRAVECCRLVGRRHLVHVRARPGFFLERNEGDSPGALQWSGGANCHLPLLYPCELLRCDCVAAFVFGKTLFRQSRRATDAGDAPGCYFFWFGRRILAAAEVEKSSFAKIQHARFSRNQVCGGPFVQGLARRFANHEFIYDGRIAGLFLARFQSAGSVAFRQREQIQRLTKPRYYTNQ